MVGDLDHYFLWKCFMWSNHYGSPNDLHQTYVVPRDEYHSFKQLFLYSFNIFDNFLVKEWANINLAELIWTELYLRYI